MDVPMRGSTIIACILVVVQSVLGWPSKDMGMKPQTQSLTLLINLMLLVC